MAVAITAICYLLAQRVPSVTEPPSSKQGTQRGVDGAAETGCGDLGGGKAARCFLGPPNKCLASGSGRGGLQCPRHHQRTPPQREVARSHCKHIFNQRHLFSSAQTHQLYPILDVKGNAELGRNLGSTSCP